jgi:F0F1-type ATP synthase assembly protein I
MSTTSSDDIPESELLRLNQKKKKKKLKEKIKLLEKVMEKQEERMSKLQTNGFTLANYYIVFQGLILTTISSRSTILRCSDSWFLIALTVLAAVLNLIALESVGSNYNRICYQLEITSYECNRLQQERRLLNPINHPPAPSGSDEIYIDQFQSKCRRIKLYACLLCFFSFAIINVVAGTRIFICENREKPKK